MEKQKEIETLRSLKGDTYFGDYFGSDDRYINPENYQISKNQ